MPVCRGFAAGRAEQLPVKPPKKEKERLPVTVALVQSPAGLLLQRRPDKGLLAGLWQPAAFENQALSREQLTAALAALGVDAVLERPLQPARHVFTHKIWQLSGWAGSAPAVPLPEGWVWGRP